MLREIQGRYSKTRDESLYFQNQAREIQIREAGIATLNHELSQSIGGLQKQIHELEDKLMIDKENSTRRIHELEQENSRLKESRRAEYLVEQSRQIQKAETPEATQPITPSSRDQASKCDKRKPH